MSTTRVAVVSGSNRGLGLALVRGLCKKFDGDVLLTARDEAKGKAAVEELEKEGLSPKFHQLDVDSQESINKLKDFLVEKYGGLDVLINNAGIAYKFKDPTPFTEQAEVSMRVNYFGAIVNMCDTLFPILRSHARVVNITSNACRVIFGRLGESLQTRFLACTTVEQVGDLMNEFVQEVKNGTHKEKGWLEWASGTGKVGNTLVTELQQKALDADTTREDIIVNCVDPGEIQTEMSSFKGDRSVEEGADSLIYCALLPHNTTSPRGKFIKDREIKQWH